MSWGWGMLAVQVQAQIPLVQRVLDAELQALRIEALADPVPAEQFPLLKDRLKGPAWVSDLALSPQPAPRFFSADLDHDKRPDLYFLRTEFTASAWGTHVFARKPASSDLKYVMGTAGECVSWRSENHQTRLLFVYANLKAGDAQVMTELRYDHTDTSCYVVSKICYAHQTEWPTRLDTSARGAYITRQNRVPLRTNPVVLNGYTTVNTDAARTRVLRENVVAELPQAVAVQVLGYNARRDWVFVCVPPGSAVTQTTLIHQQDLPVALPEPYLLGWVPLKLLHASTPHSAP